ncbi:hypothetical protein BT96DRAFT_1003322 [Gymnopus androsaceus JB14]|uniref:Uncharacterized protein n=1 Tax=Gymnopus androsaceus JB14 TaxID=1447944 RepID=A0A6A4GWF7_9AGAR|nr:hypothetical protein BT96DRAFT_1003322 [Gymnopus androsaceus JB14]
MLEEERRQEVEVAVQGEWTWHASSRLRKLTSPRAYETSQNRDLKYAIPDKALTHPAHAMSFELWGAFMAYDHLHETLPELNAVQVEDITESIALHTTQYFQGNSSATGSLLQNTAIFDIWGYDVYGPGSFAPFWNTQVPNHRGN